MTDIHVISWTIEEAKLLKPREPNDLDVIPSLDQVLVWPQGELPVRTGPDESAIEITSIKMATEEPVSVSHQPTKVDEPLRSAVNKITWQKVGRVNEPGRYMFTFGWLTISADDIAVWGQFPTAAFTLIRTMTAEAGTETASEEYRLGTFELRAGSYYSESEK